MFLYISISALFLTWGKSTQYVWVCLVWDFFLVMIIPYNLLSQPGSVLLTGNANLKEAVLELKIQGRKEKTMAWIKIIPLDRNG